MEGTMGHLLWSRYPLVPLVWRFTIMGDLPSLFKKKKMRREETSTDSILENSGRKMDKNPSKDS